MDSGYILKTHVVVGDGKEVSRGALNLRNLVSYKEKIQNTLLDLFLGPMPKLPC